MLPTQIAMVQSDLIASRLPTVYFIHVENFNACYVGQTRMGLGPIGRLQQHLSQGPSNTFRQRICRIFDYEEVELQGITFVAVPLVKDKRFNTSKSEYRLAVEYLVQQGVLNILGSSVASPRLISRVTSSAYALQPFIIKEADRVINQLQSPLEEVLKTYQKSIM